jgi:transposase
MARKQEVKIKETTKELKQLLHQQKSGRIKERVQVLYLIKSQQVASALTAATLIGRDYSTVKRWLRIYRETGIKELLKLKHGGGRSLSLSQEVLEALEKRLQQPQGFDGYEAVQLWLQTTYGIELPYSTLHGIVHNRLKSDPKVVRPQSAQRDEFKAIDFKKKALRLSQMAVLYSSEHQRVRYWCTDESRFGLKTVTRRRLTQRGVKPIGQIQWLFKSYYLYGLVEPLTGESLFLEYSHLNTEGFQAYLQEFSSAYPHDLHLLQLDNARFHTAKRLILPDNIILWFQPPHSPDCNPIERLWAWLKGKLAWKLFDNLEELKQRLAEILTQITTEFVASLTGKRLLSANLDYLGSNLLYKG